MTKLKVLRFAMPNMPPWFAPAVRDNVTHADGIEVDVFLVKWLCQKMNVTPEVTNTLTPSFGTELGPGNWTGAMGMMIRGEADVMVGQYMNSPNVFPYVQFSTYTTAATYKILSGPPNKISKETSSFLSSVNYEVWLILAFSWFLMSLASHIIARIEDSTKIVKMRSVDGLGNLLLAFYGLLFERGFDFLPESDSRRLLLAGWLILSEVLMTCVAGVFASKLAIMDVPDRIDTLEDLLRHPDICPYLTKGVAVDSYLHHSKKPVHQAIWRRTNQEDCDGNRPLEALFNRDVMQEMNEGRAVIIANSELCMAGLANYDCQTHHRPLYVAKETFLAWPYVYVYSRHLPEDVQGEIALHLMKLVDNGFLKRKRPIGMNLEDAQSCFDQAAFQSTSISALEFKALERLFQLWAIGLSLSVFALALEIFHSRIGTKRIE